MLSPFLFLVSAFFPTFWYISSNLFPNPILNFSFSALMFYFYDFQYFFNLFVCLFYILVIICIYNHPVLISWMHCLLKKLSKDISNCFKVIIFLDNVYSYQVAFFCLFLSLIFLSESLPTSLPISSFLLIVKVWVLFIKSCALWTELGCFPVLVGTWLRSHCELAMLLSPVFIVLLLLF